MFRALYLYSYCSCLCYENKMVMMRTMMMTTMMMKMMMMNFSHYLIITLKLSKSRVANYCDRLSLFKAMSGKTVSVNGRRRRKSVSGEQHFR